MFLPPGIIRIISLVCLAVLCLAGNAFSSEVVLYSSNPQSILDSVALDFEAKTGIKVKISRMGTGEAMRRIQEESENPGGDVFWSGDMGLLDHYKINFEPYASPELAAIPEKFRDPENRWIASNVHLMIIMANTQLIPEAELPKTWGELLDPKWKGKIVMANPKKSGSAYAQLYGLNKLFGEDGLRRLAENVIFLNSSGQVYKRVAKGDYALGLTMEYAAYELLAKGLKGLSVIYPREGVFVAPEAAAIIADCKHPEEAEKLLDYLLSKEFESDSFVKYFRRPARTDIADIPCLPAQRSLRVFEEFDSIEANSMKKDLVAFWSTIHASP